MPCLESRTHSLVHKMNCADQKLTHVDSAGKESEVTKAKLKTSRVANKPIFTPIDVILCVPPRREYRMHFAEFSSQGGRSTPASLQSPHPSPQATFLVLAWQGLGLRLVEYSSCEMFCLSPSVRTERTPVNLTYSLSLSLSSTFVLRHSTAPQR